MLVRLYCCYAGIHKRKSRRQENDQVKIMYEKEVLHSQLEIQENTLRLFRRNCMITSGSFFLFSKIVFIITPG